MEAEELQPEPPDEETYAKADPAGMRRKHLEAADAGRGRQSNPRGTNRVLFDYL